MFSTVRTLVAGRLARAVIVATVAMAALSPLLPTPTVSASSPQPQPVVLQVCPPGAYEDYIPLVPCTPLETSKVYVHYWKHRYQWTYWHHYYYRYYWADRYLWYKGVYAFPYYSAYVTTYPTLYYPYGTYYVVR